MFVQQKNGTLMWVMIYVFPIADIGYLYWTYRIFELLLHIPSLLITIAFCRLALRIRMFHANLTFIFVAFLIQWVEIFIAEIFLLPYSEGFIRLPGYLLPELGVEPIMQAKSIWDSFPLFLGGFLRARYVFSVTISMSVVVIERSIATFWLRDYEKHSRVYISVALLFMANVYTSAIALLTMLCKLTLLEIFSGPIALNLFSVVWYFVLVWYNTRVQYKMSKSHRTFTYSLAARFQAKENLRTLKMARNVFFVWVAVIVINTTLIAGVVLGVIAASLQPYTLLFFTAANQLSPLFVVPTMVLSIPEWKQVVVDTLPLSLRRQSLTVVEPIKYSFKPKEEADVYWKQFDKDWRQF